MEKNHPHNMTLSSWLMEVVTHPLEGNILLWIQDLAWLISAEHFYYVHLDFKQNKMILKHAHPVIPPNWPTFWKLNRGPSSRWDTLSDHDFLIMDSKETDMFIPIEFFNQKTMVYGIPLKTDNDITGIVLIPMNQDILTNTEKEWLILAVRWMHHMTTCQTLLNEASKVKQHMLSNVSHELRTPISGIQNALNLLNATDLSAEQKKYLSVGQDSLHQLSKTIHQLLDYSQTHSDVIQIERDVFLLEDLVVSLIHQVKVQADEKGIDVQLDFDYRIQHKLMGDHEKLKEMLMHLLDNAIKYTASGEVKLKVSLIGESGSTLSTRFLISDTGIGISKEEIEHILKPLHQVENEFTRTYQGLGLGLSIVAQYAALFKTELKIESTPNQGSEFSFDLSWVIVEKDVYPSLDKPILMLGNRLKSMADSMGLVYHSDNESQPLTYPIICITEPIHPSDLGPLKLKYGQENTVMLMVSNACHETPGIDACYLWPLTRRAFLSIVEKHLSQTKTVLETYQPFLSGHIMIVDDNRLNRLALESILSKMGLRSTMVESGLKALDTITKGHIDLILMDIQMPGMDGIETTRKIRHLGPDYEKIPIIAVTANHYFKDYDLLKSAKINDVLIKPIQWDELNHLLRKHMPSQRNLRVPSHLMVFDEIEFNKRFEGALDIALEVVSTFKVEQENDLIRIKKAIMAQDGPAIIEATHYFKGSCSYLSAKRAVWVLNRMMDDAKKSNMIQMNQLMELMEIEIRDVMRVLNTKYQD